jgi:hypothetical protein
MSQKNIQIRVKENGVWVDLYPKTRAELVIGLNELLALQLATKQDVSEKNQAFGYAGLDEYGKISEALLPASALSNQLYIVADLEGRDSLENLKHGDKVFVLNPGDTYVYDLSNPVNPVWHIIAKSEWQNVAIEWNSIINGPQSSPTLIDDAVNHRIVFGSFAPLDSNIWYEELIDIQGDSEGDSEPNSEEDLPENTFLLSSIREQSTTIPAGIPTTILFDYVGDIGQLGFNKDNWESSQITVTNNTSINLTFIDGNWISTIVNVGETRTISYSTPFVGIQDVYSDGNLGSITVTLGHASQTQGY